jgi:hypothetical protein
MGRKKNHEKKEGPQTFPEIRRKDKNDVKKGTTDLELAVLLEEYKTLRDEIISLQEFTRQNITTIYAGIGVIGAVSTFLLQKDLTIAFLLFPFLFYSLALTTVKYALAGINMGNYIKSILTPNIQRCLKNNNPEADFSHILSWENQKGVVRRYGFWLLPATGAHYWLPLLAAILFIVAYFFLTSNPLSSNSYVLVLVLLFINGVAMIYTIFTGLYAGFSR